MSPPLRPAIRAYHDRDFAAVEALRRGSNRALAGFYERHGFRVEDRVSMGRAL